MKKHPTLILTALTLLLLSGGANATLIGDRASCSFELYTVFDARSDCSTSEESFVPGPATVIDSSSSDFEYFIGATLPFVDPVYYTGASIDIDSTSITLSTYPIIAGQRGTLLVNIGSLDWTGYPASVIEDVIATSVNLDPRALTVTHSDRAVLIAIRSTFLLSNVSVQLQLIPSHIPVPASLALMVLGLGLLSLRGRHTKR